MANRAYIHGQFLGSKAELDQLLEITGLDAIGGKIQDVRTDKCNALQAKVFMWKQECDPVDFVKAPTYLPANEKDYGKYKSEYGSKLLDDRGIDVVVDEMRKSPANAWIQFEALGGLIRKVSNNETPYNHRDALFSMQYMVPLQKGESRDSPNYQWILGYESSLKPFVNGQHYQNYPDLDIGAGYGEAYWGKENYARLQQIKKIYDPENIFRNEQSVPLPK